MTFVRPTLSDLRQQAQADIQAALPGADALLRYSNLAILAAVMAALANGHYGYLDWIARQAVPFTAVDEALEGWAALKAVTRKPATKATGSASFTGAAGAIIPAGTAVVRGDGFTFTTTTEATLGAGGATVAITAVGAGAIGNTAAGTALTLSTARSGVASTGIAAGPVTGGADVESDDSLRQRMLAAFAAPPQGGSASDYRQWALAVPGVTRCWVSPGGMGPGTVVVHFMMDAAQAARGGFPAGSDGVAAAETRDVAASGDQRALADALFVKQPVTPIVYAVAPRANTLDFTIAGLTYASTLLKAAVAAAIDAALFQGGRPGGVTNVSAIEAAIAAVNGTAGFVLMEIVASAGTVTPGAAGNIVSQAGRLPVRGAIRWA